MKILLNEKNSKLMNKFCNLRFELKLAYLVTIFEHLNNLNLQLQGCGNQFLKGSVNIFIFEDEIRDFVCKINL